MSLITRTYTFTDGTTAYGSQVDSEVANIVNALNSLDQGNTTWTNVKVTTLLPQADVNCAGHKVTNIANGTASTDAVAYNQISGVTIVTGSIIMYPLKAPPSGYLYCDGSAVSRGTYATLYGLIGNTFGRGDNVTTFNLPDYRGKFIRGVSDGSANDPDAASRTAQATGGNTGDAAGSCQANGNLSHTHVASVTDTGHAHNMLAAAPNVRFLNVSVAGAAQLAGGGGASFNDTNVTQTATTGITVGNANTGGNESRPINTGIYFHIKI